MAKFDWEKLERQIVGYSDDEIKANFCDIMQTMMKHGSCNCLINDDNGHWAIAEEGEQSVSYGKVPMDLSTSFYIEAKRFSKTIPRALRIWAEEMLKESEEESD